MNYVPALRCACYAAFVSIKEGWTSYNKNWSAKKPSPTYLVAFLYIHKLDFLMPVAIQICKYRTKANKGLRHY